ncbi:MAG TPA: hypothetical protein VG406_22120 [Isosphaeraceae bacterium]|jgi:hypothetical protein|nr:hypothetical protein [Isosphaeraceae bacterium]
MSTLPTPNTIDVTAEDGSRVEAAHGKRNRRPKYPIPLVVTDIYIDTTFNGPNIIYQPPGETTNYSFQVFRATQDSTGSTTTAFDFYGNGMLQYLYIPLVQPTTSSPNATPPCTAVVVQTDGVATEGPPPTLDQAPLYYTTFSVTLNKTTGLAFRHRSLGAASNVAPASYIPDACAFRYRSGGSPSQPEVVLRLHNVPSITNPVDFVWRKINTCCTSGVCPLGLASGPEDLVMQAQSFATRQHKSS